MLKCRVRYTTLDASKLNMHMLDLTLIPLARRTRDSVFKSFAPAIIVLLAQY